MVGSVISHEPVDSIVLLQVPAATTEGLGLRKVAAKCAVGSVLLDSTDACSPPRSHSLSLFAQTIRAACEAL